MRSTCKGNKGRSTVAHPIVGEPQEELQGGVCGRGHDAVSWGQGQRAVHLHRGAVSGLGHQLHEVRGVVGGIARLRYTKHREERITMGD
jgi:hypothetical protein